MGAFDLIWSDIGRTKEGHVYVVDESGWGWFALFIIVALPFFMAGIMLKKYAEFVCVHPILSILIYLLFAMALAVVLYYVMHRPHPFLGTISCVVTMLPIAVSQMVYGIPYIMQAESLIGAAFEWLIVTAFMLGVTVFVLAISTLIKSGFLRLLLACLFLTITLLLVRPPDEMTWEMVIHLYQYGK